MGWESLGTNLPRKHSELPDSSQNNNDYHRALGPAVMWETVVPTPDWGMVPHARKGGV